MAFDLVEFALDVEAAFNVRIPDTDAEVIRTPGQLIEYLEIKLPASKTDYQLIDRAFQLLRKVISAQQSVPLTYILLKTSLYDLFPKPDRGKTWAMIGRHFGIKRWPRIGDRGWFSTNCFSKLDDVEKVCSFLVGHAPASLKELGEGWTRNQIADVVHRLIVYDLVGNAPFFDDSRFTDDLGFA